MKKFLLTILAIFLCGKFVAAQKASDVLEFGIQVKSENALFLKYDTEEKVIKYAIARSKEDKSNPIKPILLTDSTIFLVSESAIQIYILPLNPLKFSQYSDYTVVIDPINEAASTAMGSIIDILSTVNPTKTVPPAAIAGKKAKTKELIIKCEKFKLLQTKVELIQSKLSDSQKAKSVKIFKRLQSLNFDDETSTITELTDIKSSITEIEYHFKEVGSLIEEVKTDVKNYDCDFPEAFTTKYIFNTVLKDLATTMGEQKKRLDNIQSAYTLVENAQKTASIGGGQDGLRWCFKLKDSPSNEGKISIYSITVKKRVVIFFQIRKK